ncbi:hypothetical protein [Rhizobium sp. Nf11,1]|uniref:hypothetical protein n=1 Tax=Rhizobium sp. Nf11,1 TaxID=3404923 RepID=UPI003D344C9B
MTKPMHIFKAALSGRYYATRSYKVHNAEKGLYEVTGAKEDVTEQIMTIIASARAEGFKSGQEAMRERVAQWKTSQLQQLEPDSTNPYWERDFFQRRAAIQANEREANAIRTLSIEEPPAS